MGILTAQELANSLLALPEEFKYCPVVIEGCDCDGDAGSVSVETLFGEPKVYINRAKVSMPTYEPPEPTEEYLEAKRKGLLPE